MPYAGFVPTYQEDAKMLARSLGKKHGGIGVR